MVDPVVLGAALDWAFPLPLGLLALPLSSALVFVVRLARSLALAFAFSFAIAGFPITLPLGSTESLQVGPLLSRDRRTRSSLTRDAGCDEQQLLRVLAQLDDAVCGCQLRPSQLQLLNVPEHVFGGDGGATLRPP